MNYRGRSWWGVWAALGVLLSCSSGGGGGVEPVNHPPTVTFAFNKIGIVRNTPTQLSASVSDPDGDPVTVTWSVTRGTIASLNTANTLVRWTPPNVVGTDSVTVKVSDGSASASVVSEIRVGSAFSSNTALHAYLKSQSPYIVTVPGSGVLAVANGKTVIEPGTELLLETAGCVIDVTDSLVATGTLSEPIVVRPNLRNLTCGDDRGWWQGIKVYTDFPVNGHVELDYAQIWYGNWAVRMRDQGSATIRNSFIRCSGTNGVLDEGGATLILENTEVSNGVLDGVAIGGPSSTFLPDSVVIDGCNIKLNGRTGLVFDLDDQLQEVPITVEYTNFEFNTEHGISLARAVFPKIHYNRFFGNGTGSTSGLNHIWLVNGYPNGVAVTELFAECNFWGAPVTNISTIEAMIRDATDTGAVGTRVVASPWSNENPLVTTSTCVVP